MQRVVTSITYLFVWCLLINKNNSSIIIFESILALLLVPRTSAQYCMHLLVLNILFLFFRTCVFYNNTDTKCCIKGQRTDSTFHASWQVKTNLHLCDVSRAPQYFSTEQIAYSSKHSPVTCLYICPSHFCSITTLFKYLSIIFGVGHLQIMNNE